MRRLRTAEIAEVSETTESTIFRHFAGLDAILATTYKHCWATINKQISGSMFDRRFSGDPVQELLADMNALWAMKNDHELAEAATVAFLFQRRRGEILGPDSQRADEEIRFRDRLEGLAAAIVENHDPAAAPDDRRIGLLTTLTMNYAATVWLTWFCMPTGSDDITEEHDLTADEAQMGVMLLVDRCLDGSAHVAQPSSHRAD